MNSQLDEIIKILAGHKISSPRLEARMILESGLNPAGIIEKRISGHPLDKLLGKKEFYKYSFFVNEDVLSPRPDTEVLVEKAISLIGNKPAAMLDLGVGSGCILLSVLKDCPNTSGAGVDKSEKALKVAEKNARNLQLEDRVKLIRKDWFEDELTGTFDIIASNPPYIPTADIETLDPEVKFHDPLLALDGGRDGLDSYKKLAEITPNLLEKNGCILLEIGINQSRPVTQIFTAENFRLIETLKDLAGIDRCLVFQR